MKTSSNYLSVTRRCSRHTLWSNKKINNNTSEITLNASNAYNGLYTQMQKYVEPCSHVDNTRTKVNSKEKCNSNAELRNIIKRAPLTQWRVYMTKEQIERVDLLTYWLKRYPEIVNEQHAKEMLSRKVSSKATKLDNLSKLAAKSFSLRAHCKATPSQNHDLQEQSQSISHKCKTSSNRSTSTEHFPSSSSSSSSLSSLSTPHNYMSDNYANNNNIGSKMLVSYPTRELESNALSRPFTSYTEIQKLASIAEKEWTDEEIEIKIIEEDDKKEWERLTTHPARLFSDEEAIFTRFGMGEYVSPTVKGFSGLFRQSWHDFHVTEMINDLQSDCGGVALSRLYSFDIPSVPSWLVDTKAQLSAAPIMELKNKTSEQNDMEHQENYISEEMINNAEDTEKVDESFFTVDAKARVKEMRNDMIAEEDLIAAREAIAAEKEKERSWQCNWKDESENTMYKHTNCLGATEKTSDLDKNAITHNANTTTTITSYNNNKKVNHHEENNKYSNVSVTDNEHNAESKPLSNIIAHIHALSDKEEELTRKSIALSKEGNSEKADVKRIVETIDKKNADTANLTEIHSESESNTFYLQCTLHKEHVAHSVALSSIAQVLRIHPQAISVSGIKDYIGDTVQRVRLKKVSPYAANLANAVFHSKECHITLSNFSYERVPLVAGDHFGNHFHIVLRDVVTSPGIIHDAMSAFHTFGFPNYYGCQRFSWFGGLHDAAFAMLRNDWLVFAFTFLNYTDDTRSLRELLQRSHKYPHAVQDEYRRNIVRRLRHIAVEPTDLDQWPFLSCPPLGESVELTIHASSRHNIKLELILHQLKEAYFDLNLASRRLIAQKLSSYLWNQVLSLRLHHFGGREVLCGDFVASAAMRQLSQTPHDRREWYNVYGNVITESNKHQYQIHDVVHPGFSFNNIVLPENVIGYYYHQICDKYHLDWSTRHTTTGLKDFMETPRPIIRYPIDLRYQYDESKATLSVDFALERGCYANVALTELMKAARCVGSEKIVCVPVPSSMWDGLGETDPGYVTSFQDIYEGYEDGEGFVKDTETIPFNPESEVKVWDYQGPLFIPDEDDPFVKAREWGEKNLLRNMQRRIVDAERMKFELFEEPLAKQISDEELSRYAGHMVPLPPNVSGKKVFHKVLRRKRRYAGAPKITPRVKMGVSPVRRQPRTKPFKTLNRDTWNVMW